jgi:D-alanine-D-alanine ligase
MRIVFTHNLRVLHREEEADFDAPETVAALTAALTRLGHEVEPLEVSGPAARLVARLEAAAPDLVFNTASGRFGRGREAFYPDLFEQLGVPFTGSDAQATAISRDKRLAKLLMAQAGLPTPRFAYVTTLEGFTPPDLRPPLIVKPNFEGSSKGITSGSVVRDAAALRARIAELLPLYPAGLIIEELIEGRDLVVPFIARVRPGADADGVAGIGEVCYADAWLSTHPQAIYEYDLKHREPDQVSLRFPAALPGPLVAEIGRLARRAVSVLELRDFARLDLRLTPEGRPYIVSVTALPSLHEGGSLHRGALAAGLADYTALVDHIVRSAAARFGLQVKGGASRRAALRVGFTFNVKRKAAKSAGDDDSQAEYDSPATIEAIKTAIASFGHTVVELEATAELPAVIGSAGLDVVFNMAEGLHGRNRESAVPAILELLSIPYTGSDSATMALTLDKALAKRVVAQHGVATPAFLVMHTGNEKLPPGFTFPAICKPVAEGSSKGVQGSSVARDEAELRAFARELIARYRQPALVEVFLPGREFTVGLLGEKRPRVLPPMEIVFTRPTEHPVYSFEHKLAFTDDVRYDCPANVDARLLRDIEDVARGAFIALGCRDVARIDVRCDARGKVNFIECNPLPGLTPDWSDLCMIAKAAGLSYAELIGEILAPAIRRHHERRRAGTGRRT